MGILRLNEEQGKRMELSYLVKQTLREGERERSRLTWDKFNGLNIGTLVTGNEGHILTLYTLNSEENLTGIPLAGFNAVDISVTKEDKRAKAIAYEIQKKLEERGYFAKVREMK